MMRLVVISLLIILSSCNKEQQDVPEPLKPIKIDCVCCQDLGINDSTLNRFSIIGPYGILSSYKRNDSIYYEIDDSYTSGARFTHFITFYQEEKCVKLLEHRIEDFGSSGSEFRTANLEFSLQNFVKDSIIVGTSNDSTKDNGERWDMKFDLTQL